MKSRTAGTDLKEENGKKMQLQAHCRWSAVQIGPVLTDSCSVGEKN